MALFRVQLVEAAEEIQEQKKKKYTVYVICVSTGKCSWKVRRRYREFRELHQTLKTNFRVVKDLDGNFPKKSVLSSKTERVQKRYDFFQKYLDVLISSEDVVDSKELQDFLELCDVWRAVKAEDLKYLEFLISSGANVDQVNNNNQIPLHYAAAHGYEKIVQHLLMSGTNKAQTDNFGMTAMHLAALAGHDRILACLLQSGASYNTRSKLGATPLHQAAKGGQCGTLQLLLDSGVCPDDTDSKGRTALHMAAAKCKPLSIVTLSEAGANVDALDDYHISPLHIASLKADGQTVTALINAAADVDLPTASGQTALHIACARGDLEIVTQLLGRGVGVNTKDNDGVAAIHFAARRGYLGILEMLLKYGALVNCQSITGATPLHEAAGCGHLPMVERLIIAKACIDIKDGYGFTPLTLASRRHKDNIVERLVALGAQDEMVMGERQQTHLYCWGLGDDGRLGMGHQSSIPLPSCVVAAAEHNIAAVSCGGQFTAALNDVGQVFTWGYGGNSRLGHACNRDVMEPTMVSFLAGVKVKTISCGLYHTAIVTEIGECFSWGDGQYGKLGHGNEQHQPVPTRIAALQCDVVDVSCGESHTLIRTRSGLQTCGLGKDGRLGTGNNATQQTPTTIPFFQEMEITVISAGMDHSCSIDVAGTLYSWGRGALGQLGQGSLAPQASPAPVDLRAVRRVVCGSYFTAAITQQGQLYTWGEGKDGKLGLGDESTRTTPHLVQRLANKEVIKVGCGGSHMIVLTSDLRVYACGLAVSGQLGIGSTIAKSYSQLQEIKALRHAGIFDVCCGSSHSAALGKQELSSNASHNDSDSEDEEYEVLIDSKMFEVEEKDQVIRWLGDSKKATSRKIIEKRTFVLR